MKYCILCFSYILVILNVQRYFAWSHSLHGPVPEQWMETKVVNGVPASIRMFPFMALITLRGLVHCCGSILSSHVILTAAHCIVDEKVEDLQVYLGSSTSKRGKKYNICKTLPHERFEWTLRYDIGLLKVSKKIKFGPNVQRARLITHNMWERPTSKLTVAGFGTTTTYGTVPQNLQMSSMNYLPTDVCNKTQPLPSGVFCLLGERWTSNCHGDSGGPAIWLKSVVGIVSASRSDHCGSDRTPSTYTRVQSYQKWIKSNTKKLESAHCHSKNTPKLRGGPIWEIFVFSI